MRPFIVWILIAFLTFAIGVLGFVLWVIYFGPKAGT
jgi:hypothetical protein